MNLRKTILTTSVFGSLFVLSTTTTPMSSPGMLGWVIPSAEAQEAPAQPPRSYFSNDSLRDMQRKKEYMRREQARLDRDIANLQRRMKRERQRQSPENGVSMHMEQSMRMPAVQIDEDDDNYLVTVNMPNADKKSIKIKLEGPVLTIAASQKTRQRTKGGGVSISQSFSSSVSRSLTLPGPVKREGMKADYEDGKLLITVPRA